ncbi:MAG: alkaline phosphatase family protein [Trueperaceae bacterium]
MSPLILVMIDGVAADYLQRHRPNLPNLSALAEEGLLVERLASDVPATSLPGRTSILTGAPASEHGIYGNTIWDGELFRYANPDDVRTPTLPRRAMDAGLDVAAIGFGMVRPEDATVFRGAWWVNEMLQRAHDEEPIRADEGWLRTSRYQDASGRLAALAETGLAGEVPDAYAADRLHYLLSEPTGDRSMLRWSAGLATSDTPPDLLITEILAPDTVQHMPDRSTRSVTGRSVTPTHWSALWSTSCAAPAGSTRRRC